MSLFIFFFYILLLTNCLQYQSWITKLFVWLGFWLIFVFHRQHIWNSTKYLFLAWAYRNAEKNPKFISSTLFVFSYFFIQIVKLQNKWWYIQANPVSYVYVLHPFGENSYHMTIKNYRALTKRRFHSSILLLNQIRLQTTKI